MLLWQPPTGLRIYHSSKDLFIRPKIFANHDHQTRQFTELVTSCLKCQVTVELIQEGPLWFDTITQGLAKSVFALCTCPLYLPSVFALCICPLYLPLYLPSVFLPCISPLYLLSVFPSPWMCISCRGEDGPDGGRLLPRLLHPLPPHLQRDAGKRQKISFVVSTNTFSCLNKYFHMLKQIQVGESFHIPCRCTRRRWPPPSC